MMGPPAIPSLIPLLIPGSMIGILPSTSQEYTQKDTDEIRGIKRSELITDAFGKSFNILTSSDDGESIADLKSERRGRNKVDLSSIYTCDIDAIAIAESETGELDAIELRLGDEQTTRDELDIFVRLPIDLLLLGGSTAKETRNARSIGFVGDDDEVILHLQDSVGRRLRDTSFAP